MKLLKFTAIIVVALTFAQCEQENEIIDSIDTIIQDNETIDKIAKLGFDTKNYPVLKDGEYFTVEGDINILADDIEKININNQNIQSKQRRFPLEFIVSCEQIRYITVFNNLPNNSPARGAVNLAMQHWNDIDKCDIRFAATSNINSAEIIISKGPLVGAVGKGSFPTGGKPGKYIRLDLDQFSFLDYGRWRTVIEHELGHNIGFAHSDDIAENGAILISGTPSNDSNSIMFSGISNFNRTLNGDDKKAARLMYNLNFSDRLCN
ncbi:M57 family metalloprotease [uncultured Aquimarina sp.]|uniref:M57 family metalloprotease n=1 Tax=uncultured Aquimarina sp. TaxID=575652 RepID=UPI00262A7C70|nr:M57 family metalloprotease [uncultured Aquimarina sp.]